jgi:bacterial/archaeal transporter family protein
MEYGWLIFALLSAIFASLVAVFGKIGLQNIDANTATAIRAVIMALFLIGVIVVEGKLNEIPGIVKSPKAITFIALSGIAGALSWLFYFFAVKIGEVSKVAPIDKLSVVFAIVLAVLILGEKLTLSKGIGAALIAVGAIIIALG